MEMSFGNWVRRRRKALDLTQGELAERVGCSLSAIYKIEADERRPSRQVAELLAERLEIPPEQRELFLKVARQEKTPEHLDAISAPAGYEALQAALKRPAALPVFPTRLVGREHEIDAVTAQMRDPACRLLTLTGPGGVGKTRLAVEAARRLEPFFADGVLFLPLAAVSRAESIVLEIASALGVTFSGPADPRVQALNALRGLEILLVLDSMEHLVGGSDFLAEILEQAPKVCLLVTSRQQLHLRWEWLFEVQGLPVPEEAGPNVLETNSAVELFLQRARQAAPHLPGPEEAAALVRICRAVDGLPLAIELAASWARVMTPGEIALELERNLDLLETNLQDVPARHRSIRVVFDQSWVLLLDEERRVLLDLSVFPGGFTRQAAEAAAGASLAVLSSLVSKSLLRFNPKTNSYDFHELIRQNALARFRQQPSASQQAAFERFCRYYSAWLAGLEEALKSPRQAEISSAIRLETANWLAAWRWAAENHRLDLLRPMVPCLYWYYEIHGNFAEALALYRHAVDRLRECGAPDCLEGAEEKAAFAFLVDQLGWFEFRTGGVETAASLFAESRSLALGFQDHEVLYHIHGNWGYMALLIGRIDEAHQLTAASLENARALRSPWHIAIPISVLGIIELQRGNLPEARRQLADSLRAWRVVGDPRGIIFTLLYLGSTALAQGSLDVAAGFLRESAAIAEEKKDRWAQATSLDLLGQVALASGQIEKARSLLEQSLALSKEIGDQWTCTQATIHLGEAQAAAGLEREAALLYLEAYSSARQGGWPPAVLEALVALAGVQTGVAAQTRLAAVLSALAHPALAPAVRRKAERLRARLAEELTPDQVEAAAAEASAERAARLAEEVFALAESEAEPGPGW